MRLGIMLSFQCRADLGETWRKAYRDGLVLAAEAAAGHRRHLDQRTSWRGGRLLPLACRRRRRARSRCLDLPHRPGHRDLAALRHPLRLAEGSVGARQPLGRAAQIGFRPGLSPRRVRAYGLNYARVPAPSRRASTSAPGLEGRALRLRRLDLQDEERPAAPCSGPARSPALWIAAAAAPVSRAPPCDTAPG